MTKEQIQRYYIEQKMTLQETADKLGTSRYFLTKEMNKLGIPLRNRGHRVGKRSPNWKGGRRIIKKTGYVALYRPDHPNSDGKGYIFEHRLVMSEYLGRPLTDSEIVHHKNRHKSDNRIENLELCDDQSAHMKMEFRLDKPKTRMGRRLKELFLSGKTWDEIAEEID